MARGLLLVGLALLLQAGRCAPETASGGATEPRGFQRPPTPIPAEPVPLEDLSGRSVLLKSGGRAA